MSLSIRFAGPYGENYSLTILSFHAKGVITTRRRVSHSRVTEEYFENSFR
jgi:hypothetical protein